MSLNEQEYGPDRSDWESYCEDGGLDPATGNYLPSEDADLDFEDEDEDEEW